MYVLLSVDMGLSLNAPSWKCRSTGTSICCYLPHGYFFLINPWINRSTHSLWDTLMDWFIEIWIATLFGTVDKFKAILNELEDHQNIAVELEDPLDPFPPKRRCCATSSLQSSPTAIPLTLESLRPELGLGTCPEVGDNFDTCHLWKDEHPFAIYFDVNKVNWRVPELGGLTS